jgi:hypothetical protein
MSKQAEVQDEQGESLGFLPRFEKKFFFILIFQLDIASSKTVRGNNKICSFYIKFGDSDHFLGIIQCIFSFA